MQQILQAIERAERIAKTVDIPANLAKLVRQEVPESLNGFNCISYDMNEREFNRFHPDGNEYVYVISRKRQFPIEHHDRQFSVQVCLDDHPLVSRIEVHSPGLFGNQKQSREDHIIEIFSHSRKSFEEPNALKPDLKIIEKELRNNGFALNQHSEPELIDKQNQEDPDHEDP